MTISPKNLTFAAALDAYTAVLQDQPGKALLQSNGEAVFLENGEIYSSTINEAGELDMDNAGCISPIAREECVDSAEVCALAVNSPVFIHLDSPGWLEFSHGGTRWAFDADQLAEWDDDEGDFQFLVFHGLDDPTVESVTRFIEQL
ncbi:hypothetical protein [Pseudomonas sp. NPDC096950]|uniref:hypothetical protein n=1 Tax=Pseudomonas sp. NPDC096950 TaxID=3364485 RepID=UPI00383AE34A